MCKFPTSGASNKLILTKTISLSKNPVLLAKSPLDSSEFVVKAFDKDDESKASYKREKEVLSAVQHPNIIQSIPEMQYNLSIPHKYILLEYAPHGDFFNLMINKNISHEKLVRTYFHQLIQGLEHLHQKNMAHLDLKLENLLLGKDLQLKIADFELTQNSNEKTVISEGTENYRAPEIKNKSCKDAKAADIYSAGVCLFALFSRAFPFVEDCSDDSRKAQRFEEFISNNEGFWAGFEAILNNTVKYSDKLRELLNGMWNEDSEKRFNLEQVKTSEWFNEPIYTEKELKKVMNKILSL